MRSLLLPLLFVACAALGAWALWPGNQATTTAAVAVTRGTVVRRPNPSRAAPLPCWRATADDAGSSNLHESEPAMRHHLAVLAAIASASAPDLTAQQVVIPAGFATTAAASSTAYPWGRGASQIRVLYIYDSSHLTNQAINFPIAITRVQWRAQENSTNAGGTYSNVVIQMSTAAVDYTAPNATFAANHGNDLQTVYSGPVTVQPGAGTNPGNWYVDVLLSQPFVYDPTLGDLAIDIGTDATGWAGGAGAALDSAGAAGATSRVYNLTNWQSPTGTTQVGSSPVIELTYLVGQGVAISTMFGAGCPAPAPLQLRSTRPVLGAPLVFTASAVPVGAPLGVLLLSFTRFTPPLDLAGLGMTGCVQYVGTESSFAFLPASSSGTLSLGLPNNPLLNGTRAFSQSAVFVAGANPLGVIASNGVELLLGIQ